MHILRKVPNSRAICSDSPSMCAAELWVGDGVWGGVHSVWPLSWKLEAVIYSNRESLE